MMIHQRGNAMSTAGKNADASPCSDASTDVPDDEEYLTEWDEWSEIEKGYGPKASRSGEIMLGPD